MLRHLGLVEEEPKVCYRLQPPAILCYLIQKQKENVVLLLVQTQVKAPQRATAHFEKGVSYSFSLEIPSEPLPFQPGSAGTLPLVDLNAAE